MARKTIVAELMAKLEADPAYRKMRAEKAAKLQAAAARWRAEQPPLLKALDAVGWSVNSVWDLVNTATPYPEAVPVLLTHLKRPYSDRTREGIARSPAIPDARAAWPILLTEYGCASAGCGV